MSLGFTKKRCLICEIQKASYPKLLEREKQIEAALHDLRHHAIVIRRLAQDGRGEKLETYLNSFGEWLPKDDPIFYCGHYLINTLLEFYAGLAKRHKTDFSVRAELPESIPVKDADLSAVLSNLLENALDATTKIPAQQRRVSVAIVTFYETLGINVQNPFDGNVRVESGCFFSTKNVGRKGVGIASVRSICRSYGGNVRFYADEENIFHSEVMLPLKGD